MSNPRIVLFLGPMKTRVTQSRTTKYYFGEQPNAASEAGKPLYFPWPVLLAQAGGLAARPHVVAIGSAESFRQWIDEGYLARDLGASDLADRQDLPLAFVQYDKNVMKSPRSPGFWAFFDALRRVLSGHRIDTLPEFEPIDDSPIEAFQTTSDDILMDITRGFRAVPFLGASALAFVQAERRRERQRAMALGESPPPRARHRIYYAALDDEGDDDTTAVWDLSRFAEAVELSDALDAFARHGRADDLADFFEGSDAPEAKNLQGPMRRFADDLLLMRLPSLLCESGPELHGSLKDNLPGLNASFPPLAAELDRLNAQVKDLVPGGEAVPVVGDQGLRSALILAERLWETGRYAELYNLLRESLLTAYAVIAFQPPFAQPRDETFKSDRDFIENSARQSIQICERERTGKSPSSDKRGDNPRPLKPVFVDPPSALTAECLKQLLAIRDFRNDVSHCSMRPKPELADDLREQLRKGLDEFRKLVE